MALIFVLWVKHIHMKTDQVIELSEFRVLGD